MRLVALFAVLTVLGAQVTRPAEPFSLQLTSLSQAWLPGSGVVRVPQNSLCKVIQVSVPKNWPGKWSENTLALMIDDRYPHFKRLSDGKALMLQAETREPLGFIPDEQHTVQAFLDAGTSSHTEWTIEHWDKLYIEAQAESGDSGIEILLQEPFGGLVVGGRSDSKVRLRGQLKGGSSKTKLNANGTLIHRSATMAGYHFDEQVAIAAGTRELILTVTGDDGEAQTVLVLPVTN